MRVKSILGCLVGCFFLSAQASEHPLEVQGVEVGQLTCACEMSQGSKLITGEQLLSKVSTTCRIGEEQAGKMIKMLSLVPEAKNESYKCYEISTDYNHAIKSLK